MVLWPIDRTLRTRRSNRQVCTKERRLDESQLPVFRDPRGLAEVESERQACRSQCQMNASIEPLREPMARTRAAIAGHSSLRFRRGPARDANAREPPD